MITTTLTVWCDASEFTDGKISCSDWVYLDTPFKRNAGKSIKALKWKVIKGYHICLTCAEKLKLK